MFCLGRFVTAASLSAVLGVFALSGVAAAEPATTAFTYQGSLRTDGANANGAFDFEARVFDAAVGGAQIGPTVSAPGVSVTDGLFSVQLDFGSDVFNGQRRWLEIAVRDAGAGAFSPLSPRQEVTIPPVGLGAAYRMGRTISTDAGPLVIRGDGNFQGDALEVRSDDDVVTARHSSDVGGNGAAINLFDSTGAETFGLEPDINGGGGFLNVARSSTNTSGFIVDGNHIGTEEPLVRIAGSARTVEFDFTAALNDDAVRLLPSSVHSREIVNEAGAVTKLTDMTFFETLPSASNALVDLTIEAPSSGLVLAVGTITEMRVNHENGTDTFVEYLIDHIGDGLTGEPGWTTAISSAQPSVSRWIPATVHHLYPVSAGEQRFILRGNIQSAGELVFRSARLSLLFVPTSYTPITRASGRINQSGGVSPVQPQGVEAQLDSMRAEIAHLRGQVRELLQREGGSAAARRPDSAREP